MGPMEQGTHAGETGVCGQAPGTNQQHQTYIVVKLDGPHRNQAMTWRSVKWSSSPRVLRARRLRVPLSLTLSRSHRQAHTLTHMQRKTRRLDHHTTGTPCSPKPHALSLDCVSSPQGCTEVGRTLGRSMLWSSTSFLPPCACWKWLVYD